MHSIHQGEGGEQGDALMPLLFSLGFAFLDDIYVLCPPASR